ncbi:MAG: hypothetical protein JNK82_36360 [Myxococcaceae bacterium]|nr:hypothetical protein [Myxococcaceae bacterium]
MSHEELEAVRAADAAAAAPPPMPKPHELPIADRMAQTKRLNAAQVAQGKAFAKSRGISPGEALVSMRLATEDDVIATEAELTSTRWMSADQAAHAAVADELVAKVPLEVCLELRVCPLQLEDTRFSVAMRDPGDPYALTQLQALAGGVRVSGVRIADKALDALIDRHYRKVDENDPSSWLER